MLNLADRLKVLINSSTPIVIMETVEEMRVIDLVRTASLDLTMPVFEWSIADGLNRLGSSTLTASQTESPRNAQASSFTDQPPTIVNTREPAQVLAHLLTMTIEAIVILKDFHRHMDDPVVIRRLRDVAQRFCANRRTLIITGPAVPLPAELASLVEYLELPLPDAKRLRQIVEETFARLSRGHSLKRGLDSAGLDAVAGNLRRLTEEEAERAISQTIIAHYGLTPEMITDVLEAKKNMLRRAGVLEFIGASECLADVGGLENLKRWLQQRRGSWGGRGPQLRPGSAPWRNHSWHSGMRQEHVRARHCRRVEAASGEIRYGRGFR